jgi:hypothetical protein
MAKTYENFLDEAQSLAEAVSHSEYGKQANWHHEQALVHSASSDPQAKKNAIHHFRQFHVNRAKFHDGQEKIYKDGSSKKLADAHREAAKNFISEETILAEAITEANKLIYPVVNARSPADQEFADAHAATVTPDANGNGDAVFKGTIPKDISRRADKWTGDDDADDAAAETGLDKAGTYHKVAEAVEQLQELSKKTLASYITKGAHSVGRLAYKAADERAASNRKMMTDPKTSDEHYDNAKKIEDKEFKRRKGLGKAASKLAEGVNEVLTEISKRTLASYRDRASAEAEGHKQIAAGREKSGLPASDKVDSVVKKREAGVKKASARLSEAQLMELSKKTLGSYAKKAETDFWKRGGDQYRGTDETNKRKIKNRDAGLTRAETKLKEEELQELSNTLIKKYQDKSRKELFKKGQDWDTFKKRSAGMAASTRAKIRNDKKTAVKD